MLQPESNGLQLVTKPFVNRYEGIDVVGDALRYNHEWGASFHESYRRRARP